MLLEREREHRPPGDIQRQPLHGLAHVGRRTALAGEFRDHRIGGAKHVRHQHPDRARRERRRQRAPLMFPRLAVRQQQAFLAEDRPQHADPDMGAAVILVVVDQHMLDRIGGVDRETVAAEEVALDDILAVGALAPGADGAPAHRSDSAEAGHAGRGVVRARRHDRRAARRRVEDFGNAHGLGPFASCPRKVQENSSAKRNYGRRCCLGNSLWQPPVHHRRVCRISAAFSRR